MQVALTLSFATYLIFTTAPLVAEQIAWGEQYNLTPEQVSSVEIIAGHSEERARLTAEALEKRNATVAPYVPAESPADINRLNNWSAGRAFAYMIQYAPSYRFKFDEFERDCPNRELFNYRTARGQDADITARGNVVLQNLLQLRFGNQSDPRRFESEFLRLARQYGMDKYLVRTTNQR